MGECIFVPIWSLRTSEHVSSYVVMHWKTRNIVAANISAHVMHTHCLCTDNELGYNVQIHITNRIRRAGENFARHQITR